MNSKKQKIQHIGTIVSSKTHCSVQSEAIDVVLSAFHSSTLLILTGSGIEMNDDGSPNITPTITHGFCSLNVSQGGGLVTTNITDLALVTMSSESPDSEFAAIHSTVFDAFKGRAQNIKYHMPRSLNNLLCMNINSFLNGRSDIVSPIPTGMGQDVLKDSDRNMIHARKIASSNEYTTMLIMGNSLSPTTNGRAMDFLSSVPKSLIDVIIVDPKLTYTPTYIENIRNNLIAYGLQQYITLRIIESTANAFIKTTLERIDSSVQPGVIDKVHELILPELISERRMQYLKLPPRNIINSVHKVGGRTHIIELYDMIASHTVT